MSGMANILVQGDDTAWQNGEGETDRQVAQLELKAEYERLYGSGKTGRVWLARRLADTAKVGR